MSKNNYSLLIVLIISNFLFGQNQWTISWNLNSELDMSHYIIFKGTSPNATTQIGTASHPDENTFIDTQVERATLYYYRLKAVDLSGNESEFSSEVSAAMPSLDFSKLDVQTIGPGENILIENLDSYVTDPDDDTFIWTADASPLTVQFNNQNQSAIVNAPSNLSNAVIAEFRATDHNGLFHTGQITFNIDTSFIIPENGKSVFAWPVPLNLDEDPNGIITFQNIPENATVLIYNLLGELVYKLDNIPYEWDITNDAGKAIYPGVYLYYVKSGSKKRTGKLVIVK